MSGYACYTGYFDEKLKLAEMLDECAALSEQFDMWKNGKRAGVDYRSDAKYLRGVVAFDKGGTVTYTFCVKYTSADGVKVETQVVKENTSDQPKTQVELIEEVKKHFTEMLKVTVDSIMTVDVR